MFRPPRNVMSNWGPTYSSELLEQYYRRMSGSKIVSQRSNINVDDDQPVETSLADRLDPVPSGLPGCVRMKLVAAGAPRFARESLKYVVGDGVPLVLNDEATRNAKLERKGFPKLQPIRREMIPVMERLTEIGMFARRDLSQKFAKGPNAHANVFLVEKPGSGIPPLLRFITDARYANALTSNNMSYNIFTLQALFQTISNLSNSSKSHFYVINADLRHWFHQIAIPNNLSALFQVGTGACGYWQQTLPMGWYLAPPIAQNTTWSFLLSNRTGLPQFVGDAHNFEEMPSWIPFQKDGKLVGGGLFVLQDNIFILTDDLAIAKYWCDRMKNLASKEHFNIKFKGDGPIIQKLMKNCDATEDHAKDEIEFTDFFGISIGFGWWRVSDAKSKDHDIPQDHAVWSHRHLSQILGVCLWDLRVRNIPSLEFTDLLSVYSRVTPPTNVKWDDIANCSAEDAKILKSYMEVAAEHKKALCWKSWAPGKIRAYAIDASGKDPRFKDDKSPSQIAIVHVPLKDLQGTAADSVGIVAPTQALPDRRQRDEVEDHNRVYWKKKKHSRAYIGDAELDAIIWAVEDAIEQDPTVTLIIIITDSLCAKGWVERMYSDRPEVQQRLSHLRSLLLGNNNNPIRINCVYIMSENNIGDVPSRDEGVDEEGYGWTMTPEIEKRWNATINLISIVLKEVTLQAVVQGRLAIHRKRDENQM